MKKFLISALVGGVSGVACTTLSVTAALTAPVSYPILGTIGGYCFGKANNVAKGEIEPMIIGAALGIVSIPFAPISLVTAPIAGVLCSITTTCDVYGIIK